MYANLHTSNIYLIILYCPLDNILNENTRLKIVNSKIYQNVLVKVKKKTNNIVLIMPLYLLFYNILLIFRYYFTNNHKYMVI